MSFGSSLRRLRKSLKMGINEVSNRSGISNAQISRLERNIYKPKVSTLEKLAKGLRVPVSTLSNMAGMRINSSNSDNSSPIDKKTFDIEKLLDEGKFATYGGKPISDRKRKIIKLVLESGDGSNHL